MNKKLVITFIRFCLHIFNINTKINLNFISIFFIRKRYFFRMSHAFKTTPFAKYFRKKNIFIEREKNSQCVEK